MAFHINKSVCDDIPMLLIDLFFCKLFRGVKTEENVFIFLT